MRRVPLRRCHTRRCRSPAPGLRRRANPGWPRPSGTARARRTRPCLPCRHPRRDVDALAAERHRNVPRRRRKPRHVRQELLVPLHLLVVDAHWVERASAVALVRVVVKDEQPVARAQHRLEHLPHMSRLLKAALPRQPRVGLAAKHVVPLVHHGQADRAEHECAVYAPTAAATLALVGAARDLSRRFAGLTLSPLPSALSVTACLPSRRLLRTTPRELLCCGAA